MTNDIVPIEKRNKLNISLDLRIIIIVLLVVIAAMLAVWRPWSATTSSNDRTVTVSGSAKLTAEPDEFVFYPSYEFKGAAKTATLAELSKKSDAVVAELKKLKVGDKKIKVNSDGYNLQYFPVQSGSDTTYTLRLTVTVGNRELAQKVQDYLLTTAPTGSVSPQATFSDAKRKELESKARDEATKDARSKADQSAKNLGFKIGKVKSVEDGAGFGNIVPLAEGSAMAADTKTSLAVQPGENDLSYSVTVVYYLR